MPLITEYTFNPTWRTVTLTGLSSIDSTLPLSINDATLNKVIYAGGPPKALIIGNIIVLPYDSIPGGARATDQLIIHYGIDPVPPPGTFPVTIDEISATGVPSTTTFLRGDGHWSTPIGTTISLPGAGMVKTDGQALIDAVPGTDFLAPGGPLGTPSSGNLSNCTFPTLNQSTTGSAGSLATPHAVQTNLASTSGASFDGTQDITPGVQGTLPVPNGGTGATSLTGVLKGTGTSAIAAATAGTDYLAPGGTLGTPSSGNLANCTFPTLNQDTTGAAASLSNTLVVSQGGTGVSTLTGLVKANGTSPMTAAVAGTDYVTPSGLSGLVPWSGGTAGILPATSGQHLTTQGGNTLDNGSGRITIVGGGTMDGVTIGSITTSPSVNTQQLVQNHNQQVGSGEVPWLDQVIGATGSPSTTVTSATGGIHLNKLFFTDAIALGPTDLTNVYGFRVNQSIVSPSVGQRNAIYGQINVNSSGTNTAAQAAYVGVQGRVNGNANIGGTGPFDGTHLGIGGYWGGWFCAGATSGLYHGGIFGLEIDVYAYAGTSVFTKLGIGITLVPQTPGVNNGDAVRGSVNDAGIQIAREAGVANSWQFGIMFGSQNGSVLTGGAQSTLGNWAFASDSTIIGTSTAYNGEVLPANIGIDFSQVTFTDCAIKTGPAPIQMGAMASPPSTPASGKGKLYVASDGSLHYLSANGTNTQLAPA